MKQTALITGASSGIGQALAQKAHELDYSVMGLGRDVSKFEVPSANHHCDQLLAVDLADLAAIDAFCSKHRMELEQLDVLILNAGYGQFGAIEQFSTAQIERLITTNLTANLVLLRHIVPHMKARGQGDIVIIGSESSITGAKHGSVYCASKFGVRGMAQSLRAECANNGVRVVLLNPGPVRTDFFDSLAFEPAAGDEFALLPEDVANAAFSALSLSHNAVVDEINLQPIKRVFAKKPSKQPNK